MRNLTKILILFLIYSTLYGQASDVLFGTVLLKGRLIGDATSNVKIDSLNVANIIATEKVILDAAAGSLTLQDGSILYFTDATEADSVNMVHDGTDFVITGDAGTTALELESLEMELSNGATIVNTDASNLAITEANLNVVGNLFLDAAGGVLTISDGSYVILTDGAETDSVSFVHDGTDLVIEGDAATTALELESLELELSNGATIVNTDGANLAITEANLNVVGNLFLDAAAGALTISDGSFLRLTDGAEIDSASIVHDGTDLVVTGDDATTALELEGLELELSNGCTIVNTDGSNLAITEENVNVVGNLFLDAAAGALTVSDGSYLRLTDGDEVDSASIVHDGTDLVITGDNATTALELEGLEMELSNGATVVNTDASNLAITEANVNIVGNLFLDAAGGSMTVSDGSSIVLTDGGETDSVSMTHDGASFVIDGDAATDNLELEDIGLELDGGAIIDNPHTDSLTLTEAVVKVEGSAVVNVASACGITVEGTPTKILSAGSYASKMALASSANTEMVTISGEGSENDWYIGQGIYMKATGVDGKVFGLSALAEYANTGAGTDRLQGAQIMAGLGSIGSGGTEAVTLKSLGGDATAGMYALWLKIGANTNCTAASGSRMGVLWLDNQSSIQAANNLGEEYTMFSTTGGTRPDGWAGFETTAGGYDQLFYFDETFNAGAGTCVTTDAVPVTQDARIKVYYNGTQYYIPLYR